MRRKPREEDLVPNRDLGNDLLDDIGPVKGVPWERFNNFVRVIRGGAVAVGRPLPSRAAIMHVLLNRANKSSPEQIAEMVQEALFEFETERSKHRNGRTRAMGPSNMRWSGR